MKTLIVIEHDTETKTCSVIRSHDDVIYAHVIAPNGATLDRYIADNISVEQLEDGQHDPASRDSMPVLLEDIDAVLERKHAEKKARQAARRIARRAA